MYILIEGIVSLIFSYLTCKLFNIQSMPTGRGDLRILIFFAYSISLHLIFKRIGIYKGNKLT